MKTMLTKTLQTTSLAPRDTFLGWTVSLGKELRKGREGNIPKEQ